MGAALARVSCGRQQFRWISTRRLSYFPAAGTRFRLPQTHVQLRTLSAVASVPAAATRWIKKIQMALEDAREGTADTFEPYMNDEGVLVLDLGSKGQYSLQLEGERLLLFSATSGPRYYVYDADNDWWHNPDDGHLLVELLVRELMHTTSACINL